MGSGFNFFSDGNGVDVTPTTTGSWQDVDVSSYIPEGSTGVILEILNQNTGAEEVAAVRKNGSTDDRTADSEIRREGHIFAFCGVDASRIFEAYVSTNIKIYLYGYCDSSVVFETNEIDKSTSTATTWEDVDISANAPSDATGVIAHMFCTLATARIGAVRKNGSTDNHTADSKIEGDGHIYLLCGIDDNKIFEQYVTDGNVDLYIVGYTKAPITFFTNIIDKSSDLAGWVDRDLTSDTEATADGCIFEVIDTASTNYKGAVRKKGSTDDHTSYSDVKADGHMYALCGLDAGQNMEIYLESLGVDHYLVGYCKQAGATVKYVTDTLSLSDVVLTNKTFTISDAIGLADASPLRDKSFAIFDSLSLIESVLRDKTFTITDQISIADQTATPTRVLQALDSIGLSENVYVNKTLTITDEIALVEVVGKWIPGAPVKTKIFLILGDIAIQLI